MSLIRKSGTRFSDKIMLKMQAGAAMSAIASFVTPGSGPRGCVIF